MNYKLLFFFN